MVTLLKSFTLKIAVVSLKMTHFFKVLLFGTYPNTESFRSLFLVNEKVFKQRVSVVIKSISTLWQDVIVGRL